MSLLERVLSCDISNEDEFQAAAQEELEFAALPPCSPANVEPEPARLAVRETGERVDE